ncbi:ChaN family lipoprotein [Megasphaera sp.]|uniref:ChaN family lipoprotein n=1 Tax=Megasphaera TaxID=906 RepID=UPI001DE3BF88|nr:ChaN family lipoprotein [Megasphaera sp.]MBS6790914.1 ChaN family lipoprotein [Megasphaera sp.]
MMKSFVRKEAVLWALTVLLAAPGLQAAAKVPDIVETATGRSLSVSELAHEVKGADVIFFGEFHDNAAIHELEEALFEALYDKKGRNLALSMEMAEQDVQPVLDAYLKGEVEEDTYLAQSRPWPNYKEAYGPVVEFAKKHELSVVAASIPRPAAAAYARTGTLDGIPEKWKPYVPEPLYPSSLAYERKFTKIMKALKGRAMPVSEETIPKLFAAQSLKDNAMAERLAAYKKSHPDHLVYHLTGAVHSGGYLGTVEQLHRRRPDLDIQVITAVFAEPSETEARQAGTLHQDEGDYIVVVPKTEAGDGG